MAYIKNNWVDREGTTRYFETVDDDGALIFTPDYTQVTELGTPVNADNMNHIEEGIAAGSFTKFDLNATYAKDDLVTVIEEASPVIYKSLQDNNIGNALSDSAYWEKISLGGGGGLQLFDTILKDHILTYEETKGLALQGTYVYKEALAGSRYGYPDFYAKCLEEYNQATTTETVNGVTVKVHSNGHKFYDIDDKTAIDSFYNSTGSAWFYGVDIENERVFLPRNSYLTSYVQDGKLPVVGNGIGLGLTDGTQTTGLNFGMYLAGSLGTTTSNYGQDIGFVGTGYPNASYKTVGVTTDPTKSGIEAKISNSQNGMYLYICVGNTTNYEGVTDVVNQGMDILEQVADKVNTDGTNLNAEGKSLFAGFAMPSSKYIDLTVGATGTIYTAPANGWFACCGVTSSSSNNYISFEKTDNFFCSQRQLVGYANNKLCLIHPAPKGEDIIFHQMNMSDLSLRFYYAEGEV